MTPGALATSLIGFQRLSWAGALAGEFVALTQSNPESQNRPLTSTPLRWGMQSLATRGAPAFQGSSVCVRGAMRM